MSKNDESQPLLDKDEVKTDYTAEGEHVAGGKKLFILVSINQQISCGFHWLIFSIHWIDAIQLKRKHKRTI